MPPLARAPVILPLSSTTGPLTITHARRTRAWAASRRDPARRGIEDCEIRLLPTRRCRVGDAFAWDDKKY